MAPLVTEVGKRAAICSGICYRLLLRKHAARVVLQCAGSSQVAKFRFGKTLRVGVPIPHHSHSSFLQPLRYTSTEGPAPMDFFATAVEDVVEGIGLIEAIRPMPLHSRGEKSGLRKHPAAFAEDDLPVDSFTQDHLDAGMDGNESDATYSATYANQADGFF